MIDLCCEYFLFIVFDFLGEEPFGLELESSRLILQWYTILSRFFKKQSDMSSLLWLDFG